MSKVAPIPQDKLQESFPWRDWLQSIGGVVTSITTGYTVDKLPSPGVVGRRAYVTDASAPTFMGVVVGGGTVVCPVFDDGSNWRTG